MQAAIQQASQVAPNDPRLIYYRGVAQVIANSNLPDAEKDLKAYLASTPDRSDWPFMHRLANGLDAFTKPRANALRQPSSIARPCSSTPIGKRRRRTSRNWKAVLSSLDHARIPKITTSVSCI